MKVSIYKAGKRRGMAAGERRHAQRKKGYGGQKFPKLAKPAKTTKKVTRLLTCSVSVSYTHLPLPTSDLV